MEGADDGGIAAAEHAQDAAFGAAVVLLAAQLDQHLVAVHGRADGLRVDEDVAADRAALAGVGNDEAVAVAMHGQASGDEVLTGGGVLGESVAVAAGLDQASAFDQRLQAFGELLALVAAQAHLADELLESGRAVRLAFDVAQDGLVSEHVHRRFRGERDSWNFDRASASALLVSVTLGALRANEISRGGIP